MDLKVAETGNEPSPTNAIRVEACLLEVLGVFAALIITIPYL